MVHRFKDEGFNTHEIDSIADQRTFVTMEVAKVEEAALNDVGSVHVEHEEIVKPGVTVEDNDEDWDLEGIMLAAEVEASELRGKRRVLQEESLRKRGSSC